MIDRLPPHDEDAERACLGTLLRHNAQIHEVATVLSCDDFYKFAHHQVFDAMLNLAVVGGKPVDAVTVANWLKEKGFLDDVVPSYLVDLWEAASAPSRAMEYAGIIAERSLARKLLIVGHQIVSEVHSNTPSEEVLTLAQRLIFEAGSAKDRQDVYTVRQAVDDACQAAERRTANSEGFSTGLVDLDAFIRLRAGELTIVGARPGIGKTALLLNFFYHLTCREKLPCFFASLEQGYMELGKRLACIHGRIDGYRVRMGWLHDHEKQALRQARHDLSGVVGWIKDAPHMTMLQIMAEGRRRAAHDNIRAVFIDYLQLVVPEEKREQRYVQVGQISRRMKQMARELKLPVIVACQVGRAGDKEEPRLSHLRESGDIEADADCVMLLHDPEQAEDASKRQDNGVLKIIVAKQRDGPLGVVETLFMKKFMRFENATQQYGEI